MFNIGDTIVYSAHGLCKIDDICEKTFDDTTRTYYVLHPLENSKVSITIPVNSKQVVMQRVMEKDEAEVILDCFQHPGIEWVENARERSKHYNSVFNTGDRKEIAKVVITLMKKNNEAAEIKKKLDNQDRVLLASIQNIMFRELAVSLDTSYEEISDKIKDMISQ